MKLLRLILIVGLSMLADPYGAEIRIALHNDPKSLDPLLAADEAAEAIRYLTEGVLIRINRLTQKPEPELATSWTLQLGGRKVTLQLRREVTFPDGSAFTSRDVVATFGRLFDPALHSPIADTFKTEKGIPKVSPAGEFTVVIEFPAPTPGFERLLDQVAISPAQATKRPVPGLGPYSIGERQPGKSILLKRNPRYWKRENGQSLPRVETVRLEIQQNRDLELLRFQRGEFHMIDNLTPDSFDRLIREMPGSAIDSGPTLDAEFLWFNLAQGAPIAAHRKAWFQSTSFRRAISYAIARNDLVRMIYRGHATPAAGFVSPANRLWSNANLRPDVFDAQRALQLLLRDGFRMDGKTLKDRAGNAVEFSVVTNAGSKTREKMAAMIQQDLTRIGIRLNIVTLEFPSLIERITRTMNYETCLLGLVNIEPDPNGLMNVLLSSAANHPWNPSAKMPGWAWEAEMDKLMLNQAAAGDQNSRKKSYDRVQAILLEQSPVIFLLHPNALSAISPNVRGVRPSAFFPRTFWDLERLTTMESVNAAAAASRR